MTGSSRRSADDFHAAGLCHLLVVSGQNVAFVLALLDPLTRRTCPANRLVLVILTLLAFVTLTRFEASVLRAAVMAGASVGRPYWVARSTVVVPCRCRSC